MDLYASVLGAPRLGVVILSRARLSKSLSFNACASDPWAAQGTPHACGAAVRQRLSQWRARAAIEQPDAVRPHTADLVAADAHNMVIAPPHLKTMALISGDSPWRERGLIAVKLPRVADPDVWGRRDPPGNPCAVRRVCGAAVGGFSWCQTTPGERAASDRFIRMPEQIMGRRQHPSGIRSGVARPGSHRVEAPPVAGDLLRRAPPHPIVDDDRTSDHSREVKRDQDRVTANDDTAAKAWQNSFGSATQTSRSVAIVAAATIPAMCAATNTTPAIHTPVAGSWSSTVVLKPDPDTTPQAIDAFTDVRRPPGVTARIIGSTSSPVRIFLRA